MAQGDQPSAPKLPPILNIIAIAGFAASLSTRSLDPVLPHVASEFQVDAATAAWLSAVTALTFAAIQPMLGAAADLFGKARLMIGCLVLLGLANLLGALAPSFAALFAARILSGIGTGGVFPIALGLTGDLVPINGAVTQASDRYYSTFITHGYISTGQLIVQGKNIYHIVVSDSRLQSVLIGSLGSATKIYWYMEPEQ